MRYCQNCGHEMADEELFCGQCGTPAQNATSSYSSDSGVGDTYDPGEVASSVSEPVYLSNYGGSTYQQPVNSQKYLGDAIAGFVCGLVGLFLFPVIMGIVAVSVSSLSLNKLKKNPQMGKGLATAGLVLGIVDLVWYFIAMIIRLS